MVVSIVAPWTGHGFMPSVVDMGLLGKTNRRARFSTATTSNSRRVWGRVGNDGGLWEETVRPGVLLASMGDDDDDGLDDEDHEILVSAICGSAVGHSNRVGQRQPKM